MTLTSIISFQFKILFFLEIKCEATFAKAIVEQFLKYLREYIYIYPFSQYTSVPNIFDWELNKNHFYTSPWYHEVLRNINVITEACSTAKCITHTNQCWTWTPGTCGWPPLTPYTGLRWLVHCRQNVLFAVQTDRQC